MSSWACRQCRLWRPLTDYRVSLKCDSNISVESLIEGDFFNTTFTHFLNPICYVRIHVYQYITDTHLQWSKKNSILLINRPNPQSRLVILCHLRSKSHILNLPGSAMSICLGWGAEQQTGVWRASVICLLTVLSLHCHGDGSLNKH